MRITDPVMTAKDIEKPSNYDDLRKEMMSKFDRKPDQNNQHDPETGEVPKPDIMSQLNGLMSRKRSLPV
jgi:hypothetical protein